MSLGAVYPVPPSTCLGITVNAAAAAIVPIKSLLEKFIEYLSFLLSFAIINEL
jgi:hypothetical protein